MTIFEEIEKVIAELPPEKAVSLKLWLNEFQTARRRKQLKAYAQVTQLLANFDKSNSRSQWN